MMREFTIDTGDLSMGLQCTRAHLEANNGALNDMQNTVHGPGVIVHAREHEGASGGVIVEVFEVVCRSCFSISFQGDFDLISRYINRARTN